MAKKYEGQHSEGQFSAYCKSNGFFRIKLQIDKSNRDAAGQVLARAMPSDFLVITPSQIKFVEVKEIWKASSFPNARFRQQYKLTKVAEHYPNSDIMDGFVLLNFVAHKLVCYFKIKEYNELLQKVGKKSLNIDDIPSKFKTDWKSLIL